MNGWDHPATPCYYEAFCREHSRYREANEALIRAAALAPGMRVLDIGAGTGRTAEGALRFLGDVGSVICVEPSGPMRRAGEQRLRDARVIWREDAPAAEAQFDRVLAGASIWQLDPLETWMRWFWLAIRPGGAFCFNIPGLNLCEPDEPGGGRDPHLLELMAVLANGCGAPATDGRPPAWQLDRPGISSLLEAAGFAPVCWSFRIQVTQASYASWLKIPVLTDRLLAGIDPPERARMIDAALAAADPASWKWERWYGWTAWKQ
jgi:SAM-dependent methyltransferase